MSNLWDYRDCVWDYRESTWTVDRDLVGYDVMASDWCIGMILSAENGPLGAYLVVDASALCGRRTVVPAGLVEVLDHDRRLVQLGVTQEEVTGAPHLENAVWDDNICAELTAYYRGTSR